MPPALPAPPSVVTLSKPAVAVPPVAVAAPNETSTTALAPFLLILSASLTVILPVVAVSSPPVTLFAVALPMVSALAAAWGAWP